MPEEILVMKDVYKSFQSNHVLKGVNLGVRRGEVHVLLGENGAGKSTLIKIITGAYAMDKGEMIWEGKPVRVTGPIASMELGIATIYQELNVIPELAVYENIFLGRELKKGGKFGMLDRSTMIKQAEELLVRLGQDPKLATVQLNKLGIGQQQLVEIAKALILDAKVLIMDEPTSSLSGVEVEQLYKIVEQLRAEGMAIVFISHRFEEIQRLGNRITILRDGQGVETVEVATTHQDYWIELMVGRSLDEKFPKKEFVRGEIGFKIENFKVTANSPALNMEVHYGEILGVSGLVGAGRTELARAIFAADKRHSGEIYIDGVKQKITNPRQAIEAGIAFITEDRKSEGLLLDLPLDFNVCLANMKAFKGSRKLLNPAKMRKEAAKYVKELQIRPGSIELNARNFSGGNQQKVVIAKWLCTKAKIFIFDEPTRGIDIGAKVEVYRLMNHLVDEGALVLMISSDLPEILGMCDRVLVMNQGDITANLPIAEATQETIMKAATIGA
ncbi:sugar ABC transporter ATP-binding protein [Lysinibacillus sp. FSL K6-0057]|uniref:sugar ABC transporter ATP-binding protein n=1 Tax=Lysinibacillus TaxID=400634 RepID=UPI00196836A1|nr:sugar ABC transporter ATP-binding protein [Lysinibacillus fusiformis]QSB08448.1 sugar ABC transporter ATP-binding protein [Lysinibacillus fusiformis]